MRETLYKAKRKDNGEWIYGYPLRIKSDNKEEIKFTIIPEIVPVTDISYNVKHGLIMEEPSFTLYNIEVIEILEDTFVEYTGLTDKNSIKVFEGDICKVVYLDERCKSSGEHYFVENTIIEEVAFYKGTFCFKTTIEDITMYRPIGFEIYEKQKIKNFEVLGNIYDNQELLNNE